MTKQELTPSKDEIISYVKNKFMTELCRSGVHEDNIKIELDSEVVDDEDTYSFLLSVLFLPFNTDEGLIIPRNMMFEVSYDRHENEACFMIGEDTETEISYGNLFAFMYFYAMDIELSDS